MGIALTYSILGVAVASTGAVFGQIMADPRVIIPVCGILLALGLSMLGVFELRVPYALQNRLNSVGGAGFAGAFAMGTVAGIIAAPCTGPALGAVLSYVATTESVFPRILAAVDLCTRYGIAVCCDWHVFRCHRRPAEIWRLDVYFGEHIRRCYYHSGTVFP